ncbi:MAG: F0F1 ATP synthase subunit gamma [Anaerolineae bacterium]|nr:F0F1 ATP synthase subunit gamma [Anaerolineae bacterium]
MAQDLEHIQSRLENIRTISPILSALRTISLGSWQMSLNRRADVRRYAEQLLALLPVVLPHLPQKNSNFPTGVKINPKKGGLPVAVLVIGSERGLCGRYNATIFEYANAHLRHYAADNVPVELMGLGKRMVRQLELALRSEPARRSELAHCTLVWSHSLPVTSLPSYRLADELTQHWLRRYEACELDGVDIIYAGYRGAGQYIPQLTHLLPPVPPTLEGQTADVNINVIIETDPLHLYTQIIGQWAAVQMYSILLESAASEHSSRYQLMESATQNADRITEELTQDLQSARRQAITREMQELAVGAGLLK